MLDLDNLKKLEILYADDDEVLRISTINILETLFDNVYSARDGKQAIEIFNNNKNIKIIMLDIKMGNISGIDVAKYIRKIDKNIQIFLVSSYTETKDLIDAVKLNLVDYLEKPFTFRQLLGVFERCLERMEQDKPLLINVCSNVDYCHFTKQLIIGYQKIQLSKNEILAIELLLEKRGEMISYEFFANAIGDQISEIALKNIISRLRKKIQNDCIKNVAKLGYLLP
jgi:DNA-binding response OmpR family regulator